MYRKFFLIPILTCVFAVTLATNSMAKVQPYLGLGSNSFDIKGEDITATNKTYRCQCHIIRFVI